MPSELKFLMTKREQIQAEMNTLADLLNQDGMPGLKGGLVDEEGFPRADIDIYAVRTARHRLACLKTDYIDVSKSLEKSLFEFHKENGPIHVPRHDTKRSYSNISQEKGRDQVAVFGMIDEVTSGSPAHAAGLEEFDQVLKIGNLKRKDNANSQEDVSEIFKALGSEVAQHINKPLLFEIIRDGVRIELYVTPKKWEGKGFIGCHIKPVN